MLILLAAVGARGQMAGMDMGSAAKPAEAANPDAGAYLMREASGTSENPAAVTMAMRMDKRGAWTWMLMGQAFAVETQQSGPRGRDKFYSVNWGMVGAERRFAGGSLMLEMMLSLEPATVSGRSYPELFQTGETAFGVPLVDGQHPHNFVMGVGAKYAHRLGRGMMEFYYAPVGDPALGPVAFPHRASAMDLPQAPLGHHWEDSTHIADDVATVAVQQGWVRLEASGFYGTEPGENRWTLEWGPMNSWATRVSVMPTGRWLAQGSVGKLVNPERQSPGDVTRVTGSVAYSRPVGARSWSSSLIWGRNHESVGGKNLNAYLLESVLPVRKKDAVSGRVEMVDKDDLFADSPTIAAKLPGPYRVKAFTGGYTRTLWSLGPVETAIGGNVTGYGVPAGIQAYYGRRPVGVDVYFRFRVK